MELETIAVRIFPVGGFSCCRCHFAAEVNEEKTSRPSQIKSPVCFTSANHHNLNDSQQFKKEQYNRAFL